MPKITVECCGGNEGNGRCLKDLCPNYREARDQIDKNWPYVGTGFGNLYGNPGQERYLARVRKDLAEAEIKNGQ